jgi:hypothetical protein
MNECEPDGIIRRTAELPDARAKNRGPQVAFSEVDLKRIDATIGALCRSRSPVEYADQLRFVYEIDGHSVSILEQRPPWDGRPRAWTSHGVARFRYFRSRGEWQLYWCART